MRSFAQKAPQPTSDTRNRPAVALSPVQQLQRRVGNQALQRMAQAYAGKAKEDAREALRIRPKLTVNAPGDVHEQEADRVAGQVMRMPAPLPQSSGPAGIFGLAMAPAARVQTKITQPGDSGGAAAPPIVHDVLRSPGQPLDGATRAFMEPRFGQDFGHVRVHTDRDAEQANRVLQAQAFTHQADIFFGAGKAPGNDALTAHELTHVLQQTGESSPSTAERGPSRAAPGIQRTIEMRPPGRGEASAFERREELINRLNAQSLAIEYKLDGRVLKYEVKDKTKLKNFDRQMLKFIDAPQLLPMRLVTSAGRLVYAGGSSPVIVDAFASGYVDLDDLLATDNLAFQSMMVHFLAERSHVTNYDRRIGTASLRTKAVFKPAHEAGHEAQAEHFRDIFSDPDIKYVYNEAKPHGAYHIVFHSAAKGNWIFLILHRIRNEVTNSEVKIRKGGKWLSVEDFLAQRAPVKAAP
jgi:hypothetical protein